MMTYDDDWDDLDDYAIEQCVLKENEILSQNPNLCKNTTQQTNIFKEKNEHWVNTQFNSFANVAHNSKTEINSSKDPSLTDRHSVNKFIKPTSSGSKKSYKPLDIEKSLNTIVFQEKKNYTVNNNLDFKPLQNELDEALKEKARLEEENLVKQGEVYNLRCELKRKEASLETERIDQCIALEAAEKRGKDKATKIITDLEVKVKKLEREVDRLEGNILFKNREVEELLEKCKQSDAQSSTLNNKCKLNSGSPSKKRKLDDRFSPNKSSSNFADRFDFGEKKKKLKNVQVQTESEAKGLNRFKIKVTSSKGYVKGSRKAFYLLSNQEKKKDFPSHPERNIVSENKLLSHMISSLDTNYSLNINTSEHLLVKHVCDNLENLLKATQEKSIGRMVATDSTEYNESFLTSSSPFLKIFRVTKTDNKNIITKAVKILILCIEEFLKDKIRNDRGIILSLHSLSSLLGCCSDLTQDLCNNLIENLSKCCEISSADIVPIMLSILNTGILCEVFRRKICTPGTGKCLLNSFCGLLKKTRSEVAPQNIGNDMTVFISRLLCKSNILITNNGCDCSFSILSAFINNLYHIQMNILKDEEWYFILNGLKVLHTWQSKDKSCLEKASQMNKFSVLLSIISRKAKLLKSKGILDNFTWELIYEIYDIDES